MLDIQWDEIQEGHCTHSEYISGAIKLAYNEYIAGCLASTEELLNNPDYALTVKALPNEADNLASVRDFLVTLAERGACYEELHEVGWDMQADGQDGLGLFVLSKVLDRIKEYDHYDFH